MSTKKRIPTITAINATVSFFGEAPARTRWLLRHISYIVCWTVVYFVIPSVASGSSGRAISDRGSDRGVNKRAS